MSKPNLKHSKRSQTGPSLGRRRDPFREKAIASTSRFDGREYTAMLHGTSVIGHHSDRTTWVR